MKPLLFLKVYTPFVNIGVIVHLDVILACIGEPYIYDDTLGHH